MKHLKPHKLEVKLSDGYKFVPGHLVYESGLGFYKNAAYSTNQKFKWHLIHLKSGLRILKFSTRVILEQRLPEILALMNWNEPVAKFSQNEELLTKLKKIQQEVMD